MFRVRRPPFRSAFFPILLLISGTAQAADDQNGTGDAAKRDLLVTLGLSANFSPQFPGASQLEFAPIPSVDIRHVGEPIHFQAPDESVGLGVLNHRRRGFDFGPAGRVRLKRDQDDVGAPVGNVGLAVEAGGFVQDWITPNLRLRAEGRKGFGGHHGWVGDLSADLVLRDDDRTIFSIGPRVRLADDRFEQAYFGISPAASARTGIPVYRPHGGLYAVGALTSIVHQLSPTWGITFYAGYDRLVRGAADSPIVRRFGSANQLSAGLGVTYTFTLHRH